jgi:hypothetical protein
MIKINQVSSVNSDILLIATAQGFSIKKGSQQIDLLKNISIIKSSVVELTATNAKILIQGENSLYSVDLNLNTFTAIVTFLASETAKITAATQINNLVHYNLYQSIGGLFLNRFNTLTQNKDTILIDPLSQFEVVLKIFDQGNDLIIVTQNRLIKYSLTFSAITLQHDLNSLATDALLKDNILYISALSQVIQSYSLAFIPGNFFSTSGIPLALNETGASIVVSGIDYLIFYDIALNAISSTYPQSSVNYARLGSIDVINVGDNIIDLSTDQILAEFPFDRDLLPNYNSGIYRSKEINISTNNDTASFLWGEVGPLNNYQATLAVTQSTDLVNFSEYSSPSSSNVGVFVPNITPLTQAVGFELFITLEDQRLASPEISNFTLNTSQKSNIAEVSVNLVKAETLVTQTSYPQKFFDQSEVRRRHNSNLISDTLLDSQSGSSYLEAPYGLNYEFKSRVRNQFGRYSKESYNPLTINYTSRNFALSAAPVKDVTFTVLNPEEIFLTWDPVTELIDGTPIPQTINILYRILRKTDSNDTYKVIYTDHLLSLNSDYVCSVDPLNNDTKQLTDGVIDPTHDETESSLIFIEPVDITFNLGSVQAISQINLSFLKAFSPKTITLQVINGATESEIFEFDNIDFSLDQENLDELTLSSIHLFGDKVKLSLTPSTSGELKITEIEIYGGAQSSDIKTFYRDIDVNFKDGSQYYYIVQALLTDLVTPTQFTKEQKVIQLGPTTILGLTDATDACLRISLNSDNSISNFISQEKLPYKLQDLSACLFDDNIFVLGGRTENANSNLATGLVFSNQINNKTLTDILGSQSSPFIVMAGINDTFKLSLDKGPEVTINFDPGTYTAIQIAFAINKGLVQDPNYGERYVDVASAQSKQIKLSRPRIDLIDRINIGSGSANDLLGFTNKSLGSFNPRIDMRSNKAYHTSWQIDNYIFVFGGMFDSVNKLGTPEILRTQISSPTNNLSLFDSIKLLPKSLYGHGQGSKDDRVFITGGVGDNNIFSDRAYLSSFDPNTNNLKDWIPLSALPALMAFHSCQVIGSYIYLIGGKTQDTTGVSVTKNIYRAAINSNYRFGSWTKIGELPIELYLSSSVVSNNKIFIIGGKTRNERLSKSIYSLEIDTNTGDILNIITEPFLSGGIAGAACIIKDKDLYLIGGEISSSYQLGQLVDVVPSPEAFL